MNKSDRYAPCVTKELNDEIFEYTLKFIMNEENTYKITKQLTNETVEMLRDDGEISTCAINAFVIFEFIPPKPAPDANQELINAVNNRYCDNTFEAFDALIKIGCRPFNNLKYVAEAKFLAVKNGDIHFEGMCEGSLPTLCPMKMEFRDNKFIFIDVDKLQDDDLSELEGCAFLNNEINYNVLKSKGYTPQDIFCDANNYLHVQDGRLYGTLKAPNCTKPMQYNGKDFKPKTLELNETNTYYSYRTKHVIKIQGSDGTILTLNNGFITYQQSKYEFILEAGTTSDVFIDITLQYKMKDVSGVPELQDYTYTIVSIGNNVTVQGVRADGHTVVGEIEKFDFWNEYRVAPFVPEEVETEESLKCELDENLSVIDELKVKNIIILSKITKIMYDKINPYKELKRVHSEGALLQSGGFDLYGNRCSWHPDQGYNIKGNISIATWDKHKDLIKVFWNGGNILKQGSVTEDGVDHWYTVTDTSEFNEFTNYLCVMANF